MLFLADFHQLVILLSQMAPMVSTTSCGIPLGAQMPKNTGPTFASGRKSVIGAISPMSVRLTAFGVKEANGLSRPALSISSTREDGGDAGMLQPRGGGRFPCELGLVLRSLGEPAQQLLDHDVPVELSIKGSKDFPLPSPGKRLVVTTESVLRSPLF